MNSNSPHPTGQPADSPAGDIERSSLGVSRTVSMVVPELIEGLNAVIERLRSLSERHIRIWPNTDSTKRSQYPWHMDIQTNTLGAEPGNFSAEMTLGFPSREGALAHYALRSIRNGDSPDIRKVLISDGAPVELESRTLKVIIFRAT